MSESSESSSASYIHISMLSHLTWSTASVIYPFTVVKHHGGGSALLAGLRRLEDVCGKRDK
jgi:hypothetical protein